MIRITSLNIRSVWLGGLEAALRTLNQGNIRIGVLQETKLTGGIHMRYSLIYKVWATEAESRRRGGIVIVWRRMGGCQVEGATNFGPNVVSFKITTGRKRWYVVEQTCPPMNNRQFTG